MLKGSGGSGTGQIMGEALRSKPGDTSSPGAGRRSLHTERPGSGCQLILELVVHSMLPRAMVTCGPRSSCSAGPSSWDEGVSAIVLHPRLQVS